MELQRKVVTVAVSAAERVCLPQWSEGCELLDSSHLAPVDQEGKPIPVTVPIQLAPGVSVTYTTRLGGSSQGDFASLNLGGKAGDDPGAVKANRRALEDVLDAPLVLVNQVHSGLALDADTMSMDDLASAEADALVTSQTGLALGIFAADCLPVLLADPVAGLIGAAHCGRRGLCQAVIQATLNLMLAKGGQLERMVATLGPAICGDCYELDPRTVEDFENRFPGSSTLTRFGGPGIDIAAAARQALQTAGVTHLVSSQPRVAAASQYLLEDPQLSQLCHEDGQGPSLEQRMRQMKRPLCTLENPLWYSHRRAYLAAKAGEGRFLALIARRA